MSEHLLREKLRKIEALFAGAKRLAKKPPLAPLLKGSASGSARPLLRNSLSNTNSQFPIYGRDSCSRRCAGVTACGPIVIGGCIVNRS